MLKKHLRGLKFRSFTRDAAGTLAWEKAAQAVLAYQAELAARIQLVHPITDPTPDPDAAISSTPTLVRR
jgi:hypothetical protein